MRSKGTETGDTLEGDPPEDEGGVSSSVPSGGVSHWTQPASAPRVCPSTSDMLYVNLEETYPASPPFLERDPNMSSAARYSPLHHAHPPAPLPPLPTQYLQQYAQHTMHTERLPPLLQVMGEETQAVETAYYPPLPSGTDAYGVSSSSTVGTVYMPPHTHTLQTHLMDTTNDLQLVLASNGEYHMIDGSGMKAEHVELLITGGQSGISYSLSSENGFIVARPTVTTCSNGKDQVDVITESSTMAVDVSLLDSLDEGSQFDEDQSIVMESETLDNTNLHLDINQSDELVLPHSDNDISPAHMQQEECEGMVGLEDIEEYLENVPPTTPGGRNRRRQSQTLLADDNTITYIPDKSVPCRARASLPAAHLCLGRVRGVFARRRIPARARFGPLEGVRRRLPPLQDRGPRTFHFLLHTTTGDYSVDVSDEKTSNWMRYVRFDPGPAQNVCLQQSGSELYFISCQPIAPRQELIWGFGMTYARRWGLPLPPPHAIDSEETTLEWPCYECSMRFASSPELQAHLNMHDDDDKKSAAIRRPKKKLTKSVSGAEHQCNICSRVFPRVFSLKRHLLTHGQNSLDRASTKITANEGSSDINNECSQNDEDASLTATFENSDDMKMPLTSATLDGDHLNMGSFSHLAKRDKHQEREQLVPDSQIDHDSTDSSCTDQLGSEHSFRLVQKENTSIEANTEVYLCNICNKMCATLEQYELHRNIHKNDDVKAVPCPDCPVPDMKMEGNSDQLKNETSKSALNSPNTISELLSLPAIGISCPICPRSFTRTWMLREHTQTQHRGADGQYDCPMCEKRLADYASIKKHIRGFHAIRRFSCRLCATNFSTMDKLKMHMLKHSDHREFLCPDCGKQFKRKDKLKDHVKKIHNSLKKDSEVAVKPPKALVSVPPADPTAYLGFTFKCHPCKLGFKRRGMLVNHLARRHPEVARASVPELQLPILRAARDYYCQHCYKVYKSSSKRKAHILKNHPGESIPPSSRGVSLPDGGTWAAGYSACVGAVPSAPHHCPHQPCHKQYASKAKLLQHIRLNHSRQSASLDSKENAVQNNQEKMCSESPVSKDDVSSSTNLHLVTDGKQQASNSENRATRTVNGNTFSQNGDIEKFANQSTLLKSKNAPSPPPLISVSSSTAMLPPIKGDNKILSGLLNSDNSSALLFSRPLATTPLDFVGHKKQSLTEPNHQTKLLTENKISSFLSGSSKLSHVAAKTGWKPNPDPSDLLCGRSDDLLTDGIQVLEETNNLLPDSQMKNVANGKVTEEEIPKLVISGHILSVEGNKLPPMSVLAGSSGKGSAMTRYTDR